MEEKKQQALIEDCRLFHEEKFFIKENNWKNWMCRLSYYCILIVVIIDELAHTNIPGSKNEKRWQDVLDILEQD